MSNNPVLSRLGFVRKAGKMSIGFNKSKEACEKGISRLIVVASDVSLKSEKEIRFYNKDKAAVIRLPFALEELSAAIGIRAGILSVNDDGFAESIIKVLKEINTAPEQLS